jgi:small subunit ribosomal protein S1
VITNIDRREHKLTLSIKAHEIAEEKTAMANYGSSDSGASLGDILGAAMRRAEDDTPVEQAAAETPVEEAEAEVPAEAAAESAAESDNADDAGEKDDKKS